MKKQTRLKNIGLYTFSAGKKNEVKEVTVNMEELNRRQKTFVYFYPHIIPVIKISHYNPLH